MRIENVPADILDRIRAHSRTASRIEWAWAIRRDDWTDSHGKSKPMMEIHIGPDCGVLTCDTPDGLVHTAGGSGDDSVVCRIDNNQAHLFPPGSALPVNQVITAVKEFLDCPGLPKSVDWARWDIDRGTVIYFDDDNNETGRLVGDEYSEISPT